MYTYIKYIIISNEIRRYIKGNAIIQRQIYGTEFKCNGVEIVDKRLISGIRWGWGFCVFVAVVQVFFIFLYITLQ